MLKFIVNLILLISSLAGIAVLGGGCLPGTGSIAVNDTHTGDTGDIVVDDTGGIPKTPGNGPEEPDDERIVDTGDIDTGPWDTGDDICEYEVTAADGSSVAFCNEVTLNDRSGSDVYRSPSATTKVHEFGIFVEHSDGSSVTLVTFELLVETSDYHTDRYLYQVADAGVNVYESSDLTATVMSDSVSGSMYSMDVILTGSYAMSGGTEHVFATTIDTSMMNPAADDWVLATIVADSIVVSDGDAQVTLDHEKIEWSRLRF